MSDQATASTDGYDGSVCPHRKWPGAQSAPQSRLYQRLALVGRTADADDISAGHRTKIGV